MHHFCPKYVFNRCGFTEIFSAKLLVAKSWGIRRPNWPVKAGPICHAVFYIFNKKWVNFVTYGTCFREYCNSVSIFPHLFLNFIPKLYIKICTFYRTFKNNNNQHSNISSNFTAIDYVVVRKFSLPYVTFQLCH